VVQIHDLINLKKAMELKKVVDKSIKDKHNLGSNNESIVLSLNKIPGFINFTKNVQLFSQLKISSGLVEATYFPFGKYVAPKNSTAGKVSQF